ncbi:putative ligninase H2 precursor [Rosellinia necatrix]|uniref:Peroxidase n=1 Tax=Rosellinia necatrix TaxID=77044 RepID=A0A1W2TF92_ROSNE|nr:putative ligninase H2 precursor [Rosellinia necatrix]
MKSSTIFLLYAAAQASAHPGMSRALAEIQARSDFDLQARSDVLLGDLRSGTPTKKGQVIKDILQLKTNATAPGAGAGASAAYTPPGPLGSSACSADPLCLWSYVAATMWADFADANGCTDLARGAVRLGFHDAGAWDTSSAYGGADGSILLTTELDRRENLGLQSIGARTRTYYATYHPFGAGMADIIQLGALVGTVACPGGPRIRAFAGRPDNARAAPTGKLPVPSMDGPELVSLFAAKTFTASDLVALVGAHTSARQRFVDPARAGAPLDPDPQIWDAGFYRDVQTGDNKTFFILHSDKALSTYAQTKLQWAAFAGALGQPLWNPAYAQAYFRMSLLGVNNLNNLTEITRVLPSR